MQNKETKETGSALKQKKLLILFGILTIIILVIVSIYNAKAPTSSNYVNTKIGNGNFRLELLNTEEQRINGLSGRESLPKNTGMLFDFGKEGNYGIWMKDMKFNIDIAWLDSNKKIIKIKYKASPEEYPEVYRADSFSRYVIEVNTGTFEYQKVKLGDRIDF